MGSFGAHVDTAIHGYVRRGSTRAAILPVPGSGFPVSQYPPHCRA